MMCLVLVSQKRIWVANKFSAPARFMWISSFSFSTAMPSEQSWDHSCGLSGIYSTTSAIRWWNIFELSSLSDAAIFYDSLAALIIPRPPQSPQSREGGRPVVACTCDFLRNKRCPSTSKCVWYGFYSPFAQFCYDRFPLLVFRGPLSSNPESRLRLDYL